MRQSRISVALTAGFLSGALVLAGCSSSSGGSEEPSTAASETTAMVPEIAVGDFTADFSAMTQLTDLAAQGEGLIQVLLPDTTTSTRYVQYDAPYLTQAFEAAGLVEGTDFKIDNAAVY